MQKDENGQKAEANKNNPEKVKKSGSEYLKKLGKSAAFGSVKGAAAGFTFAGPPGSVAGAIVGPPVQMLYDVSKDIIFGEETLAKEAESSFREHDDIVREYNRIGRIK